ncbi:hypothetical protein JB92DRAFT_3098156 [Gautieria morchelliformis]|nr:hypothetical protein JB92DRAFT_3098156 [Gautieria morchelliformis]
MSAPTKTEASKPSVAKSSGILSLPSMTHSLDGHVPKLIQLGSALEYDQLDPFTVFYGLWFEYVSTVERLNTPDRTRIRLNVGTWASGSHRESPTSNTMPFQGLICLQHIEKVLIQVHSFFLSHHHDRDVFAPCGPVALGGHITVMDMSAFRFSCPAARTHHTPTNHGVRGNGESGDGAGKGAGACMCGAVCVCATVSGFGCMCPRRQRGQHRGRVLPLLVREAVVVPTGSLMWRALHLLHLSLLSLHLPLFHSRTFLLLPTPPALSHRRPHPLHTSTTFPCAPTHPPQRFHHRVARREAAHAMREVVLEPIIQSMTLISGRPFIKPVYTLVGLEGTGFVLVVSSSTGAAWELFRDGGSCPYGSGGKGWLARMSSSGGGAGAVQARLYYIMCHEHIPTMMKMVVYMCTVAIVLFAVTWI